MNVHDFIEKNKKTLCIVVSVVLLGFLSYFCVCEYLYDNGGTANDIRERLNDAQREQRNTTESIERIESGLGSSIEQTRVIREGLSNSQSTTERITGQNNEARDAIIAAQRRISESQSVIESSGEVISRSTGIIEQIRKGSKSGD